jgi:transcription initiation factor TFIIIB Brf1 subunit/transcription initiation factor TFIIB
MDYKFSCPQCGSEVFKTKTKPKRIEDFNGAVCNKCGTVITEDDIKAQALKIADDLVRDAFRKAGFK